MTATILDGRTIHDGWSRFSVMRVRLVDGNVVSREVEDHGNAVAAAPLRSRAQGCAARGTGPPGHHHGWRPEQPHGSAGRTAGGRRRSSRLRAPRSKRGNRRRTRRTGACGRISGPCPASPPSSCTSTSRPTDAALRTGTAAASTASMRTSPCTNPLADLAAQADRGELADMKTALLLTTLRLRRPELFS